MALDGMMGGLALDQLSNMLAEGEKREEEMAEQQRVASMGPGDIGPKKVLPPPEKKKDPQAIWDEDEVDESKLLNKIKATDKREKPKYDLRYRQKINTDDALGMPTCQTRLMKRARGPCSACSLRSDSHPSVYRRTMECAGQFIDELQRDCHSGHNARYQILHGQAGREQERVSGAVSQVPARFAVGRIRGF